MPEQSQIHLILQYYRAGTPERQVEIDTCLQQNLQNQHIAVVHLMSEENFDLSRFPNGENIQQTVIGERLTYEQAFRYANAWPEPVVWILANADIYFDDSLRFLHEVDLLNTMFAVTRHDVQPDGNIKLVPPEFAHACQDAWVFTTPVPLERIFTGFCLGIPGCDHRISHEFVKAGYIVLNPSLRIIARHLDIVNESDINARTNKYVSLMNEESYRSGKAVSPPYQHFLHPTDELLPSVHALYVKNLALHEEKHQLIVEKNELESEKTQLIAERTQLGAEKVQLESEKTQLIAEKALSEIERMQLESEKTQLLAEKALSETEKVQLKSEKSQSLRDIHELKREMQGKDNRIHALENSLSWRITAPLRRLGYVFPHLQSQEIVSGAAPGNTIDLDEMMVLAANAVKSKPTVLVLDFNLGGGSNLYSRNLITNLEHSGHKVIVIEYQYGSRDYHVEFNTGESIAEMAFTRSIEDLLRSIVEKLAVDFIMVSQLVTWPETGNVLGAVRRAGVPYLVLVHDYFMICPNWALFDYQEKFCGIPDDPAVCAECLEKIRSIDIPIAQHTNLKRIESWRNNAGTFLEEAGKIICFSDASLQQVKKAYPHLDNLVVNEHCIPERQLFRWQLRSYEAESCLTVAVIGGMNVTKGSKFLDRLINSDGFKKMPVRIVMIGEIIPPPRNQGGQNANFILHGSYSRGKLGELLEHYNASMVMIPSLWPETFCYTASEALLLGYPLLCFDLGAQAERIRRNNCGWVASEPYIEGALNVFKEILANPDTVREKSKQARNYIPPTAEEHFSKIAEMFG